MSVENSKPNNITTFGAFSGVLLITVLVAVYVFTNRAIPEKSSWIIKSDNYTELLAALSKEVDDQPTHLLPIINSVAIDLTSEQKARIASKYNFRFSENSSLMMVDSFRAAKEVRESAYLNSDNSRPVAAVPYLIDADLLHYQGRFGDGVTIAFIDTGISTMHRLNKDVYGRPKAIGIYDAQQDKEFYSAPESSGHGTHVASVASNSDFDDYGRIYGVAPNAFTLGIKAFDNDGRGNYADVIRGIDYAVRQKDWLNIRVLNMSFSGPVRSQYWDDPLNQAVMKAWDAGIVVIASAGNKGPEAMTIGVPGNVPYIITVGAMTDNYTPFDASDDKLASFSSTGPTVEGFVKPEILAPGGHVPGLMSLSSELAIQYPEYHDGYRYFRMSGTSQAAAVVSGVAALMISEEPYLKPNDVKCRLIRSAKTAMKADDEMAYSVFQQGVGMVNAYAAMRETSLGCANEQLDIKSDIAGTQHYYGPADIDQNGMFYIKGAESYSWNPDGFSTKSSGGFLWRPSLVGDGGFLWRPLESDGGFLWRPIETDSFIWQDNLSTDGGFLWRTKDDFSAAEGIDVNVWVEQQ